MTSINRKPQKLCHFFIMESQNTKLFKIVDTQGPAYLISISVIIKHYLTWPKRVILAQFQSTTSRTCVVIVGSDELEVTGVGSCCQIRVIIVRTAESSSSLNLCIVGREVRAGNGHCSIKQQSGLPPAAKPHSQDQDNESQKEGGHGHKRDDQI